MLYDIAVDTAKFTGRPYEVVLVIVQEFEQLMLFLWVKGCVYCDLPLWQVFEKRHPFHLTFLLECFFFVSFWLFDWWGSFVSFNRMDISLSRSDTRSISLANC